MKEEFYPAMTDKEFHKRFADFIEYPTDLTTMAQIARDAGFRPQFDNLTTLTSIMSATVSKVEAVV